MATRLVLRPTWPDSARDTDFTVILRDDDPPARELDVGRIFWNYAEEGKAAAVVLDRRVSSAAGPRRGRSRQTR